MIAELPLSDEEKDLIFYKNGEKLLLAVSSLRLEVRG
jgi:hypothetical protein